MNIPYLSPMATILTMANDQIDNINDCFVCLESILDT